MSEKIKDFIDIPVYVYLYEDGITAPVLLAVVFNGLRDAVELLMDWLQNATDSYLDGLTATVIDDDPLDDSDVDQLDELKVERLLAVKVGILHETLKKKSQLCDSYEARAIKAELLNLHYQGIIAKFDKLLVDLTAKASKAIKIVPVKKLANQVKEILNENSS